MKNMIFFLVLLISNNSFAQITNNTNTTETTNMISISSNDVEKIYTQAIDSRFAGDLAKSRFLLESLKESGFTDEFVMSLLLEIYIEYLTEIIQKQDQATFQISYPGIRANIVSIWDMYPDSKVIQNFGLQLSILVGDQELGIAMSRIILVEDSMHLLANYVVGVSSLIQKEYEYAIPFLKKVAYSQIQPNNEQYIYQARSYLGDTYLNLKLYKESIKYYQLAMEMASSLDLVVKAAVVDAYLLNIPSALEYFKSIPPMLMTPEIYSVYISTLSLSQNSNDRVLLNTMLLSQYANTPVINAVIQAQLGRTQKALKILDEDTTTFKEDFPGIYYTLYKNLLNRLGQTAGLDSVNTALGKYHFSLKQFSLAREYLSPLDRNMDTNGKIARMLSSISISEWDYKTARILMNESISKKFDLNNYVTLIQINIDLLDLKESRRLIDSKEFSSFIKEWLEIYILYKQNKIDTGLERLLKLRDMTNYKSAADMLDQLLISFYFQKKDYEQVEKLVLKFYNEDPYNINNQNHLAYFYAETQTNLDKALEVALDIVAQSPNDVAYLDTLAWVYTMREDYSEAQEIFNNIETQLLSLPFLPNSEEIYAHLGYFYAKIGENKKSEEFFKKGFDINPDSPYTNQLYNKLNTQ